MSMIITIDGPAGTGKSTVAKALAKQLGFTHFDTGAMYRAVALYAMENNFINDDTIDEASLVEKLDKIQVKFIFNSNLGFSEIYLNGENVENEIRRIDVSNEVSRIAAISAVRKKWLLNSIGWDKTKVL